MRTIGGLTLAAAFSLLPTTLRAAACKPDTDAQVELRSIKAQSVPDQLPADVLLAYLRKGRAVRIDALAAGSQFKDFDCAVERLDQIETAMVEQGTTALMVTGLSKDAALRLSKDVVHRRFAPTRAMVLSQATNRALTPSRVADLISQLRALAAKSVIERRRAVRRVALVGGLEPGAADQRLSQLTSEARAALADLPPTTRTKVETLLRQAPSASSLPVLPARDAVRVLVQLSDLREAEDKTASVVRDGAEAYKATLGKAVDALDLAPIHQAAYQYDQIAQHIASMNAIDALAHGPGGAVPTDLLRALPADSPIVSLVQQGQTLLNAQSAYVGRAQAALGIAGRLIPDSPLKHNLDTVSSALGSVGQILNAAGPLPTLLALGTGAGPLGLLAGGGFGGGLFGGNSEEEQRHARLMQELRVISQQLVQIERKIDQLLTRIDQIYADVSNALENVNIVVGVAKELIVSGQLNSYFGDCVLAKQRLDRADAALRADIEANYTTCISQLARLFGTEHLLITALPNYKQKLGDRTLQFVSDVTRTQAQVPPEILASKCDEFLIGHPTLSSLEVPSSPPAGAIGSARSRPICGELARFEEMIDPGVISEAVVLEGDLLRLAAMTQAPRLVSTFWNAKAVALAGERWPAELKALELAVGQQYALAGGPALAVWRSKLGAPDKEVTDLLQSNEILAENIVRYWLWETVRREAGKDGMVLRRPGSRAQYALAYELCTPDLLGTLTSASGVGASFELAPVTPPAESPAPSPTVPQIEGSAPSASKSDESAHPKAEAVPAAAGSDESAVCGRSPADRKWSVRFAGIPTAIRLPAPRELYDGDLRSASTLESVRRAREDLLYLMASSFGSHHAREKELIVEIAALQPRE